MGKASFLSTFFQYASFIASGDPPSSIGEVSLDKESLSIFSFIRLVGCAYFKSYASTFEHPTPVIYSNPSSTWDHHTKWLARIRKTVWLREDSDSTCLQKMRWIYQVHVCVHALVTTPVTCTIITLCHKYANIALTGYGWSRQGESLDVVWDVPRNIQRAKQRAKPVLGGCKCKTGCGTRRCGCRKNGRFVVQDVGA